MVRGNPSHTGRSGDIGPTHQPVVSKLLQVPSHINNYGGGELLKGADATLYAALGGNLYAAAPYSGTVLWTAELAGQGQSVPVLTADGKLLRGVGWEFGATDARNGKTIWATGGIGGNVVFNGSPAVDADGNAYFVHDAFYTVDHDGKPRWWHPYNVGMFHHSTLR